MGNPSFDPNAPYNPAGNSTPQGSSFDPNADYKPAGEQINDVGNTVIVPKDGESFSDTMKRAAAQGKKTTPEQVNAELKTTPKKAATVIAAAPVIGAGGAAALAGAGDILIDKIPLAAEYAEHYGAEGIKAIKEMVAAHPEASKAILKTLIKGSIGAAAGEGFGHAGTGALIGLFSSLLGDNKATGNEKKVNDITHTYDPENGLQEA